MKLDTSTDPQVGYRPPGTLDIATAFERYDGPFARRNAAHLLRRAGFGGTPAEIDRASALGAQAAVDALLHPVEPEVAFADYPSTAALFDPKTRTATAQMWWLDRMLRTQRPLNEKMTLFWHGHFATSITKVPANLMVGQIDLLRGLALGHFHDLLLAVSKDPAMLVWLDNRYNNKAHPNENYAREVMELFALGLGNYTEDDVKNAARAFTGWTLDKNQAFAFRPAQHDDGPKTFLGRTGNLTGEDIVATIVAQPIHQRFICRKLLEYFVYSDPEPELVDALARTYALSGYNIAKTVATILRSNVFYSTRAYRALPKSPIEFAVGTLRFMQVREVPKDTIGWLQRMGQVPLAPPSVKGWDGGPMWVNTSTLLARFNYVSRIVKTSPPAVAPATPMTAMAPTTATTPATAPAVDLATFAAYTPDDIVREAGGMNVARVLATIARDAVQDDLTSDVRSTMLDYLESKNATLPTPFGPENYQEKIRGALALVLNLPSNQLN
ncbi:MAG: DUF1800 domain-containing protein [Candidatus Eremiobacteraeota bacterium]|nr:DUF1800 domain-containing protein [Candidatus Eremiobacteraeota bacterium]